MASWCCMSPDVFLDKREVTERVGISYSAIGALVPQALVPSQGKHL